MASISLAVFLLCNVFVTFGASINKQHDRQKKVRDVRDIPIARNIMKRSTESKPTFEPEAFGVDQQENGNTVMINAMKRHEGVFLDQTQDGKNFLKTLEAINSHSVEAWTQQKDAIYNDLRNVEETRITKTIKDADTFEEFYHRIIEVYTYETGFYRTLNNVLRNYKEQSYSPYGSYALMLNVVLTQWTSLSACKTTTYRGHREFDTDKYTVDTIFTWTAFTSSSRLESEACEFASDVLFIIDNSQGTAWAPRNIDAHSEFSTEAECLYPAPAIFIVTRVQTFSGRIDPLCQKKVSKYIYIRLQQGSQKDDDLRTAAHINGNTAGRGTAFVVASSFLVLLCIQILIRI